jgi:hypothetical protein
MEEALRRIAPSIGGDEVIDRLAALSGSDFTSVMLEVARRRAASQAPAGILRRYASDRFVRPGSTSARALRRAEDVLLSCLDARTELVTLAPLVPLGTHSALGTVSQHKVVTTLRACEVAADPTNALALEAASRRMSMETITARRTGGAATADAITARGMGVVRLAAIQRVVRAQPMAPGYSAHFSLFGMVMAGRDTGNSRFEIAALAEHVRFAFAALAAAGLPEPCVALTPLSERGERIVSAIDGAVVDRTRSSGRGYYRDVCFKINSGATEIGDGGFTDWTAKLTGNNKERLLISGLGLDRLAAIYGNGNGNEDDADA